MLLNYKALGNINNNSKFLTQGNLVDAYLKIKQNEVLFEKETN